jgi:hypothetical protein
MSTHNLRIFLAAATDISLDTFAVMVYNYNIKCPENSRTKNHGGASWVIKV